jgi:hypothetical protein
MKMLQQLQLPNSVVFTVIKMKFYLLFIFYI